MGYQDENYSLSNGSAYTNQTITYTSADASGGTAGATASMSSSLSAGAGKLSFSMAGNVSSSAQSSGTPGDVPDGDGAADFVFYFTITQPTLLTLNVTGVNGPYGYLGFFIPGQGSTDLQTTGSATYLLSGANQQVEIQGLAESISIQNTRSDGLTTSTSYGESGDYSFSVTATVIPEPSVFCYLIGGLVMFGAIRRFRLFARRV